jgi:hypothetical protein
VRTHLATNGTLLESVRAANSRENVKLLFNSLFESAMQELLTSNFDLYKRVTDDAEFGAYFKDRLFDAVYADLRPPLASAILGSQLSGQSPTPSAHYG